MNAAKLALAACFVFVVLAAAMFSQAPAQSAPIRVDAQLRALLLRTCAIHQYEDLSAHFEADDDARELCAEVVSQVGR